MDYTDAAATTAKALAGAGVVWAAWAKLWVQRIRPSIRKRQSEDDVERMARIFGGTRHMLREWRARHGAQRVLCLSAKNSGKPWPPDSDIRVSCLDQSVGPNTDNTCERWQGWRIDPDYREVLHDVITAGERGHLVITDNLPHSILRDAYEAQGTVASVIFAVHWITTDNAAIYISINFGEELTADSEHPGESLPMIPENKAMHERQARALFAKADAVRRMAREGAEVWKHRN